LPVVLGALLALLPSSAGASSIIAGTGATAADIQDEVDAFRAALGNPNNANAPGPLAGGRREINWDGGAATTNAIAGTPFNGFLNTRGAQFFTPGTGFVQGPPDADDPNQGVADVFNNPTYGAIFSTFSPLRVFVPIDSNVTDIFFFIPGSGGEIPAGVSGFGAVFTDVDVLGSTTIEFFDRFDELISSEVVPAFAGDGTLSFLGLVLDPGEDLIAHVRITTGNSPLGPDDNPPDVDVVAMDDFLFGEPQRIAYPGTLVLLGVGLVAVRALAWGVRRRSNR
jgi:hypothetical protein